MYRYTHFRCFGPGVLSDGILRASGGGRCRPLCAAGVNSQCHAGVAGDTLCDADVRLEPRLVPTARMEDRSESL